MPDDLPYLINDADNHFVEPLDMYERYIEPRWRDKAVRFVTDDMGRKTLFYGGRPSASQQRPQSAAMPSASARAATSSARRVLPMPGSPTIRCSPPRPACLSTADPAHTFPKKRTSEAALHPGEPCTSQTRGT